MEQKVPSPALLPFVWDTGKWTLHNSPSVKMAWYSKAFSLQQPMGTLHPKASNTIYNLFIRAKNSIKRKTYLGRVGAIWPISPFPALLRKEHELSNGRLNEAQREQLGWDKGFQKSRSYLQFCAWEKSHSALRVEPWGYPQEGPTPYSTKPAETESTQGFKNLTSCKRHLSLYWCPSLQAKKNRS